MTDDDKALVEEVQNWAEVLRMMHRGGDIGTDDPATCMDKAADRIEAQAAEIERLREALTQIARLRTDLRGDFSLGSKQSDIARAALGDTQ